MTNNDEYVTRISMFWGLSVIGLLFLFVIGFGLDGLNHRIQVLERACHGQCKYGDAECDKRCHEAGHCEAR